MGAGDRGAAQERGLRSLGSILIDCNMKEFEEVILTRRRASLRSGSGWIENACGGNTGRSPSLGIISFGDHRSGRQTRKHVWRSRSQVPAALCLGVHRSIWASGRQTRKDVWRCHAQVPAALFLGVLGTTWGLKMTEEIGERRAKRRYKREERGDKR